MGKKLLNLVMEAQKQRDDGTRRQKEKPTPELSKTLKIEPGAKVDRLTPYPRLSDPNYKFEAQPLVPVKKESAEEKAFREYGKSRGNDLFIPLETNDGKKFAFISYGAYDAIRNNRLATYMPVNDAERNAISNFADYNRRQAIRNSPWGKVKFGSQSASSLGQFGKGNIDLFNPQAEEDAELNIIVNYGDKKVIIPTVRYDGAKRIVMSDAEALENYKKTGKYYGEFNSQVEADFYLEKLRAAQNFNIGKKYKSTANGKKPEMIYGDNYKIYYSEYGYDDVTYELINDNKAVKEMVMYDDIATDKTITGTTKEYLDQMTQPERDIYNYLYNTKGKVYADEYLSGIVRVLTARQRKYDEEGMAELAKKDPFGTSMASVILSPLKTLSYVGQVGDYLDDGEIDQNAGYNMYVHNSNAVKGTVSDMANKNFGSVGGFAYDTGMSMAESMYTTAISGGNKYMSLGIMGTGAAADTVVAARDRGLSSDRAMGLGFVAGVAEIASESIKFDALFDSKMAKESISKYLIKNTIVGGMEEVAADDINFVADLIISQDKSEWMQQMKKYERQGKSQSEAFGLAVADLAMQRSVTFASGAFSGGTMAGGGAAITSADLSLTGKRNFTNANSIINDGLRFDKNSEAYKNAMRLQNKRKSFEFGDSKKDISYTDVGRQFYLNREETVKQIAKLIEADKTGNYEKLKSEAVTAYPSGEAAHLPLQGKAEGGGVFGENGQKAFEANYREEQDANIYTQGFNQFYRRGFIGQDYKTADRETQGTPFGNMMSDDQKTSAYYAGVNDAKISLEQQKNRVETVNYFSKEAGIVGSEEAEQFQSTDKEGFEGIDILAKALGTQIIIEKDLGDDNAYIIDGEGKIHISLTAEHSVVQAAAHDVVHRMQETAPVEYQAYRNFVVANNPELVSWAQRVYSDLSVEEQLDEAAAEYARMILPNGAAMKDFVDKARSGALADGDEKKSMNILRSFYEALKSFIQKVKNVFKGNKKAQNKASQNAFGMDIDELETARDLLEKTFRESEKQTKLAEKGGRVDGKGTVPPSTDGDSSLYTKEPLNGETEEKVRESRKVDSKESIFTTPKEEVERFAVQLDNYIKARSQLKVLLESPSRSPQIVEKIKELQNEQRKPLEIGKVSAVLKGLGADELPMVINSSVVYKVTSGVDMAHSISVDELKKLPMELSEPIMVFNSDTDKSVTKKGVPRSLVFITSLVNEKGHEVIVAVHLNKKAGFAEINDIASLYSKTDEVTGKNKIIEFLDAQLSLGNLRYIDKNKSDEWLRRSRLQLPRLNTILASNNNILQKEDIVNRYSMQNAENYVTKNEKPVTKATESVKKSRKTDEDILKQNATLKKANLKLREEFAKLQSGKKVADTKRIATVVKNLLDENGFSYNSARLTEQFESLTAEAQAIFEGKMDFETFSGKVRDVARAVIDEGTRSDSVAYQESKAVRDYLRTTAISLSAEDRANFGDEYETIRKGTFGRFRLVKEGGTPIDVAYQEMSELFPEYFSTETEVGASAQLRQIVDVLDGLRDLKQDPFGGYTDEATEWLSGMMIDRIFNEVFVSGSTGKVDVSVDMKALRETMGDNLQNIMNRERSWRTKEYDKLQKKFEKKTKSYTESRQKAIKIKQVKLHTERLSKALVNPSERFAVPENLKKPVAEFLQCIDLTSDRMGDKTREQLGDLMKTYKAMAEQEYELNMVIDPDLYNNLEAISDSIKELGTKDTRLSDLPLATLEKMRNAVMAMEASLRNYNRAFREGKAIQIDALAEAAVNEIKELRKDNKKNSKIWGGASDLMNFDMLNPWDYFHQMGGTFEELFMGLREGENKQIRNLALAKNYLDKVMKEFGVDPEKVSGKKAKSQTFKLANGETVELTKAQLMSLYALWRRNASHEHILEGGFRPAEIQQRLVKNKEDGYKLEIMVSEDYSSVRPSLDDVAKILDTLSDNEKKFAESISQFFTEECAEWGNEVAMQLYGYKKFKDPNYFPINTDDMYRQESPGVSVDATIKNQGFTQKLVEHANNPVIIEDIFEVYARHTSDMAKYNAYVLPLQDIQRVFNSRGFAGENNVKALIASKYGRKAVEYFSKLMIDINAGIKNEYGDPVVSKRISRYKKAKIGANARVVIQQPMSYIRAAALIDPKYLASAFGKKVDLELVYKYSPIAQWKDWGFFSIDTGKSMYDLMTDNMGALDKLTEKAMWAAGKADQMTWKRIWAAVEYEIADLHPELAKGSEDFYKAVGKRFDEVIDRTQVVDSTLHRSQILRSPDTFTKMSVSFMSEPMKTYNLLRTAVVDSITRGDKKGLARTVAVTTLSSVALACVTGAFDTLTGEEDEEFWENFLSNLAGDYTGMIPYFKDLSPIFQAGVKTAFDVGKDKEKSLWETYWDNLYLNTERMDMQAFDSLLNSFAMFASDKYTTQYKIANMVMKVADYAGVPASSFKKSVYDTVVKNVLHGMGDSWVEYNMAKQMYPVNGKMKGEFLNILFDAYKAGDKEQYDKIFADMIKEGIDAKSIESGLKSRYKDSGIEETFSVPWNNKTEIPKQESEDKFDLEDLDAKQYEKYSSYAVELETDVVGDVKNMYGEFDDETYNSMLSAAYDYVQKVAMEKTAPDEYDLDTEWILNALEAEAKYGIDPAEYIRFKEIYTLSNAAMEQYDKIIDSGQEIDFEKFLDFRTKKWNTDAKDENGVSVNGLKKERLINYLNNMDLTDEEWWLLYTEVGEYK